MKIFYAVSTHWDREWYKPFQGFRYDLVKTTDKITDALESGKLACFTFDGQTIVLEDYLEIKPQNRKRLESLIKSGKLKVGPWYIMPDELSVSGESIIRNFLTGKRIAESFGAKTWKYGYINDIFGHIAQMPQILNGFGINAAYMGRGLGAANQNFKNFIWRAPDGSECFAYKETYGALADKIKASGNREKTVEEHISDSDDGFGGVILLYAHDHISPDENMLEFEKIKNKLSEKYDISEGLEGIGEVLENVKDKLPVQIGELINTAEIEGDFRAVANSISAYYPLKFQNDMCENLLDGKTAPMLVLAKCMGINIDTEFYHTAEKYLLKNQPHDSICGCSCETVHADMAYRYSQVNSVAEAIERDFEDHIAVETGGKHFISVINPAMKKHKGVFVTDILFEKDWQNTKTDNARYQQFCEFDILDEKGNKVPYQILDIENGYGIAERPYVPKKNRYRIAACGELNSFGETVFEIVPQKPLRTVNPLSGGDLTAENEFIRLEISSDGSVGIFDKESGRTYKNLNTFIDDGETGNGWFSERPAACNNTISSKGCETVIEIINRGELLTSFRVKKIMCVPKFADYHTMKRSEDTDKMIITTDITLKKGSKAVEFKTTVDNTVRDHRIRVEFPTDIEGDNYFASQAFTFLSRHRSVTPNGINRSEPESYYKNTSGIISVQNSNSGLSFVSKAGIHECGVSKNGVISATMLRSFGRFMFENSRINEHGQIQGKHTYYYALTTETDFAKLNDLKKSVFDIFKNTDVAENKKSVSFFELIGNVNVSTVKPAENGNGFIVRLYNTKENAEKCTLLLNTKVKKVSVVNLAEEELRNIDSNVEKINLEIGSNKIETLYIEI